jgi:hypothetical protein
VTQFIPASLHADLSPLLVQAGEWPDARDLRLAQPPARATSRMPPRVDRARKGALLDVASLAHPWLRGATAARLYATQDGALYYKLAPPKPKEGEDPVHPDWLGWLSWEPCADPVRALAFYGRLKDARGEASAALLTELLGELLCEQVHTELKAASPVVAPAVQGPEHAAAIYRLDPAGLGAASGYLYAYTNGARVVGCLQPLVDEAVDSIPD